MLTPFKGNHNLAAKSETVVNKLKMRSGRPKLFEGSTSNINDPTVLEEYSGDESSLPDIGMSKQDQLYMYRKDHV